MVLVSRTIILTEDKVLKVQHIDGTWSQQWMTIKVTDWVKRGTGWIL